jgi:N-acetylneuraminic acid mutarotase
LNDLWKYNPSTNEWTWISGDNTVNQPGVYGTKRVPSTTNKPGARLGAISWTDAGGNLWLFGGGTGNVGSSGSYLNDLWKYNLLTCEWTWVSGDNTVNQQGIYGTKGVAAPTNKPGGRRGAVSWIDAGGNLWLMAGYGYSTRDSDNNLNDLWKYNPSTGLWTWVSGDDTYLPKGEYGTKGIASTNNRPSGGHGAVSWIDAAGNLVALWRSWVPAQLPTGKTVELFMEV